MSTCVTIGMCVYTCDSRDVYPYTRQSGCVSIRVTVGTEEGASRNEVRPGGFEREKERKGQRKKTKDTKCNPEKSLSMTRNRYLSVKCYS